MDIKILSREEWNSHPAVELVCQRHNDETPIYRLKAGWYYGDLSIPILEDGSVCAGLLKWLSSEKYNRFFGVLKGDGITTSGQYQNHRRPLHFLWKSCVLPFHRRFFRIFANTCNIVNFGR
mgnify:CR=1 FL=1